MDLWQGGAAQLGQGTRVQGSRDKGRLNTGHQTCLGFAASPGAPAALGKTRSFGTAGKARLGGEAGVTAQPSPDWPVPDPDPQALQPRLRKPEGCAEWGGRLISTSSLTSQPILSWAPLRSPGSPARRG